MCEETMMSRVIKARKAAGYKSQQAIADDMGITRDAYAWYETKRLMTTEHLPKFCQLTGVRMEWLLTGEGEMTETKNGFRDSANYFREKFKDDPFRIKMFENLIDDLKGKE